MTTKKVGVGARDHEVQTVAKPPIPGAKGKAERWCYQARCSCGWRGPDRSSAVVASDDEQGHLNAEVE
jgi:hypothetical protein